MQTRVRLFSADDKLPGDKADELKKTIGLVCLRQNLTYDFTRDDGGTVWLCIHDDLLDEYMHGLVVGYVNGFLLGVRL
jgi:hypothetical protein